MDKCPQCSHSPISPDSCTPHKSVRKSIKALVNKKEKKLLEAAKNATAPTEETPKPADTTNVETTGAADSAVPTVESAPDVKDGASEQTTDKPQSTVQDKESKSPEVCFLHCSFLCEPLLTICRLQINLRLNAPAVQHPTGQPLLQRTREPDRRALPKTMTTP